MKRWMLFLLFVCSLESKGGSRTFKLLSQEERVSRFKHDLYRMVYDVVDTELESEDEDEIAVSSEDVSDSDDYMDDLLEDLVGEDGLFTHKETAIGPQMMPPQGVLRPTQQFRPVMQQTKPGAPTEKKDAVKMGTGSGKKTMHNNKDAQHQGNQGGGGGDPQKRAEALADMLTAEAVKLKGAVTVQIGPGNDDIEDPTTIILVSGDDVGTVMTVDGGFENLVFTNVWMGKELVNGDTNAEDKKERNIANVMKMVAHTFALWCTEDPTVPWKVTFEYSDVDARNLFTYLEPVCFRADFGSFQGMETAVSAATISAAAASGVAGSVVAAKYAMSIEDENIKSAFALGGINERGQYAPCFKKLEFKAAMPKVTGKDIMVAYLKMFIETPNLEYSLLVFHPNAKEKQEASNCYGMTTRMFRDLLGGGEKKFSVNWKAIDSVSDSTLKAAVALQGPQYVSAFPAECTVEEEVCGCVEVRNGESNMYTVMTNGEEGPTCSCNLGGIGGMLAGSVLGKLAHMDNLIGQVMFTDPASSEEQKCAEDRTSSP